MPTNPNDILKQISQTGNWSSANSVDGGSAAEPDITTPPPPPPQGWGDLAKDTGKLAVGSTEGAIGAGERFIAPYTSDPNAWRQSGSDWVKSGQDWSSSLSPAGQQTTDAPFFSNETWQHPLNKTIMGIGKQGPWLAPALIPGGGIAAGVARAGIGAALGYTGAYSGVIDTINAQPDDQLQKNSPTYMELRKTYPEYDAKQMLADQAWDNIGPAEKAAIMGTSAVAAEAGPVTTFGKTLTGAGGSTLGKLASGRIGQTIASAVETGGAQGAQYAGTAIPTRSALTSVGMPADTPEQIARGTIEATAMGAVIGGGLRFIRPQGGKNESRSDTTPAGDQRGGAQVTQVAAGAPDPAQAQALKSAAQPVSGDQQELPLQGGRGQAPPPGPTPPPPPAQPPPRGPYQQPLPLNYWRSPSGTDTGIPPRPAAAPTDVAAPRPGELPMQQPGQPPQRQGELPLQAPSPPVDQGELPGMAPRQPVTQLGLPGMGADVVHAPGEDISRPPEQAPKPPEPAPTPAPATGPKTPKKAKAPEAPITKVSEPEPEPTAAPAGDVKGRIQEVVDNHPTPDNEPTGTLKDRKAVQERAASIDSKITPEDKQAVLSLPKEEAPVKSYITFANVLAHEKVPTASNVRNFLNAEKDVRDHFGGSGGEEEPPTPAPKPKPGPTPSTKVSDEIPIAAKSKTGKALGTFDTSKIGVEPTPIPAAAKGPKAAAAIAVSSKAEAKRLAAIDKLVGKKEPTAQVDRPTVEPIGGVPVTVLPSGMPAHTKIVPGEKAKAIVAKFAPKGEGEPTPKVGPKGTKIKDLGQLGAALAGKEGEKPAPPAVGKIAQAIKNVVKAKGTFKPIEDAKAAVEPNPTEAQKAAGNFKQGHPPASATQGQPVTIHSAAGKPGEAEGHILGTSNNIPGKPLDILTSKFQSPGGFHVVNELDPNTGRFIGHVAVLGANSDYEANKTFLGKMIADHGIDTVMNKQLVGGIVSMSKDEFEHFKQTRNPNEPVYPSTEGQHPLGWVQKSTKPTKYQTQGSSTLKTALEDALTKIPDTPEYGLYRKLAQQLIKYMPDVPIYYMSNQVFESHTTNANAIYAASMNHILMGSRSQFPELTLLHEALHGATIYSYMNDKVFKARVDALLKEYKAGLPGINETATTNILQSGSPELLAELAKPFVQKQLARIQMSDELAGKLNMSGWAKGTRTLWNGIVNSFKDALRGMGMDIPGKDDASKFTLLDGLLRLNDEALLARSAHARTDFANMIRASKLHNADIFTEQNEQHNTQQGIIDTVHEAAADPAATERTFAEKGSSISDRAEDMLHKVPRGIGTEAYYGMVSKLMTTDAFRMANEKFFGALNEANPFRKYVEKTLQRARDFEERLNVKRDFVAKMGKATADIGRQESEKLSDLLSKATAYRFDPRSPIGEGMNGWLKIAADRLEAARAKGEEDPNLFYKHQQALDKSSEITNDFNALHPKAKEWFGKLVDDYAAKGRERAEISVDQLLHTIDSEGPKFIAEPKLDPNDPSSRDAIEYAKYHNEFETNWDKNKAGLRQRILDDNLTENDTQWLANRGIDTTDDIHALSVPKGPYVPLDHAGDWIINARYKTGAPEGAKQINDNTYEFKTPEEMKAFLAKQPPNSRPYVVHYNDEGKAVPKWEKWQNADGSMGFAKDNKAWRVEVNNKYYSGHDNLSSAKRRYEELKATGAFAKIAEPAMKQTGWYSQLEVSSPLFKKLISSIDKRTDYTEDQKRSVKQLLTDTAIGSMEGNRIAKTLLPRKMVAGWDTDFIKTYDKYADMHNALMSRNKYAKDMGDIQNEMIKHTKDNEYNPGNTERSAVLDELHDRDNFFGSPDYVGGEDSKFGKKVAPILRKAAALSFLNHMVSVGHIITHSTHQILTADVVAAKYGGLGTMGEAARLHSILSGAGFKNAWRSLGEIKNIITKDSKGLNYVEGLMNALDKHRYGAELRAFMDKAIESGRVHPDQGFDTSIYHISSGTLDAWASKMERVSRQLLGSTEAYNRVWGHALAYVRAREAGESIEQATRSSFDAVSESQGLLSRANMSPIMSKWYMRPTMQFRGWGMNMMMTIARSFYNAFKGETREAKVEAWKRIAYLFGTTAALTGINGLPSDPMRIALALAGVLGITNYNWADAQNTIRDKLAEMGGPQFANAAMDGLLGSMGPFGFFGADRVGFGSLLVFGEPKTSSKADFASWMWGLVGGAPGQTIPNIVDGVHAIQQGDIPTAVAKLVPLKLIDDWAKAWKGSQVGVPTGTGVPGMSPYSTGETIMQGLGLTPARQERYREARTTELRAEQTSRDEVSQILNAVGTSSPGPERLKAMQQVSAYNLQHPEDRITPQDVVKAVRRSTAPSGLGKTLTKRNRDRIQQTEMNYGFGTSL